MIKNILLALAVATIAPCLLHAQVERPSYNTGHDFRVGGEYAIADPNYWGNDLHLASVSGFANESLWGQAKVLGVEANWHILTSPGDIDRHEQSFLVGPRASWQFRRFQPFGRAGLGLGRFSTGGTPPPGQNGNHFATGFGGGLDFRLNRYVELRPIDYDREFWRFSPKSLNPTFIGFGAAFRIP